MSEVRAAIVLSNAQDRREQAAGVRESKDVRCANIDALVDTWAVLMLLPQDLVETLGLPKTGKAIVALANDEKIELEVAEDLRVRVGGREWTTDCLVGPPPCEPLLGHIVMERLDLTVDPLRGTIGPRPESPRLPSLKMK